jgi:hypothetical protein
MAADRAAGSKDAAPRTPVSLSILIATFNPTLIGALFHGGLSGR